MIATLDTETAGFFGPIRLMGWFNRGSYNVVSDPREWWEYAKVQAYDKETAPTWYAHNLDFDLSKLWKAVPEMQADIDWHDSININHRMVRCAFKCGVVLQDSLALLPGTLGEVLESWGTKVGKLSSEELAREGGFDDVEDYFKRVPVTDPKYREYLRHDVVGLHEVLSTLHRFTGLSERDFCKRLTTASLAMMLYQTWYPDDYETLSQTRWNGESDKAFRRAYYGGRTEVFCTHVENGYHYDVNSLYPHVMGENAYPVGYPKCYKAHEAECAWREFLGDVMGFRYYEACIVTAVVHVPKSLHIPPLPVRHAGRLVFPIGKIKGTWCGVELENAVKHGCTVLRVDDIAVWTNTSYYFTGWVEKMAERKCNSTGAERSFYKLLQNALYGKFAQRREQTDIAQWTPDLDRKLHDKHREHTISCTELGYMVEYEVKRYAKHMQPHIAAHITANARVLLYNAIMAEQDRGNVVVYTDTDSLVTTEPMAAGVVGPKLYGLWKLEREVTEGIYVSPKLYAERELTSEYEPNDRYEDTLKGKGLIRQFRDAMTFDSYREIVERLTAGELIVELYRGIPNRRRFLRSLMANKDMDEPRYEQKSVHAGTWQKRQMDWATGETKPWSMKALRKVTRK